MKLLQHRISNWSQTKAGPLSALTTASRGCRAPTLDSSSRQLRPVHQQAGNRAPYTTKSFSASGSSINTAFHQASSTRVPSMHTFPTLILQGATKGQAPFNTDAATAGEPTIHDVFESKTGTWQYVVADPSTLRAVIIDPVLDYDPATQVVTTRTADSLLSLIKEKGYKVDWVLETHAHADHLTAASYLQKRLAQGQGYKPPIGIGKRIRQVQELFSQRYGIPAEQYEGVFDKLFEDDETFDIGALRATAVHLPGHTPDHLGYKVGDNVFCGDSLFHVDIGTARCDFPGGSANNLFNSGRKLLGLADHVKIWMGHDYPPEGRGTPVSWLSVRDHRGQNMHLKDGIVEEEFVFLRKQRDAKLAEPRLLHQSLQMNIRAGRFPEATESGHRMLRLPLKLKGVEW